MITFVVALYEEAKSIITHYNMKKRLDETFLQYFTSSEAELIITGVGYSNVYKSVTRHFALRTPAKEDIVVNVGICGTTLACLKNRFFYVNKITDSLLGRTYYPDLLFKNTFVQSSCTSYNAICESSEDFLVDMEAAPLFDCLSPYFSPDRMFYFKFVSDYIYEDKKVIGKDITEIIGCGIGQIIDFTTRVQRFYVDYCSDEFMLSEELEALIEELNSSLSLTKAMRDSLIRILKFRGLNTQESASILNKYTIDSTGLSKNDKKAVFNKLKDELLILDASPEPIQKNYYSILNSGFTNIYIEEDIDFSDLNIGIDLANKNIIRVSSYKDVFNRSKQNIDLQKRSPALVLAKNYGTFLSRGAEVCQDFGNKNFYYCSLIMNCIFDCDYCYLAGMYPSSFITMYVNVDKAFDEITYLLEREEVYLCISYDTDILAFEKTFSYVKRFIDFASLHPNLTVEIRTKLGNPKIFGEFKKTDNVIFAWTLTPDSIAKVVEPKASPLQSRINALISAREAGFKVRICIDPIIYTYNWKQEYEKMIDMLFDQIKSNEILDASVGVFRISTEYLKLIRRRRPNSPTVSFPFECENGVAHYGKFSKTMIEAVRARLEEYLPSDDIYEWTGEGEK